MENSLWKRLWTCRKTTEWMYTDVSESLSYFLRFFNSARWTVVSCPQFSSYLLVCHALCCHFPTLPSFSSSRLSLSEGLCFRPSPCSVVFEIVLVVWGSKTCFGFNYFALGVLLVLPGLRCFGVWLIKFWQRHASVLLCLLWAWRLRVFGGV